MGRGRFSVSRCQSRVKIPPLRQLDLWSILAIPMVIPVPGWWREVMATSTAQPLDWHLETRPGLARRAHAGQFSDFHRIWPLPTTSLFFMILVPVRIDSLMAKIHLLVWCRALVGASTEPHNTEGILLSNATLWVAELSFS